MTDPYYVFKGVIGFRKHSHLKVNINKSCMCSFMDDDKGNLRLKVMGFQLSMQCIVSMPWAYYGFPWRQLRCHLLMLRNIVSMIPHQNLLICPCLGHKIMKFVLAFSVSHLVRSDIINWLLSYAIWFNPFPHLFFSFFFFFVVVVVLNL